MPVKPREKESSTAALANVLTRLRALSGLTQAEVAKRMGTTQTAIARLERGEQSPGLNTLQSYARATGFCLEIGFVRSGDRDAKKGCIVIVDNAPGSESVYRSSESF
jgi:transcriptional regulator with XRE-family HTH domain